MGVGGGKCVQGGGVVLIFLATAVAIFVDEPFLNTIFKKKQFGPHEVETDFNNKRVKDNGDKKT